MLLQLMLLPAIPATIPAWPVIRGDVIDILVFLQEVRYVKERIALQAQVHESRLHARKNPGHASFVDAGGKRVLVGALKVHLYELIVLKKGHSGLVPVGRDHHFLAHASLHRGARFPRVHAGDAAARQGGM